MKQRQAPMRNGKLRHFLPWLTACTYGQLDATGTWEGALHSYGGGATGFSFFLGSCLDDPAKVLALSSATALATPFEDHFLDGQPMLSTQLECVTGQLRAWSGMKLGHSIWIVLTPGSTGHTAASTLVVKILVTAVVTLSACDLTTGQSLAVTTTVDGVELRATLSRTTVLHVAPGAAANCSGTKLPPGAWLPVPGYNYEPGVPEPWKSDDDSTGLSSCPCADASLCRPVQTPRPEREVMIPLDMNSPAYGHGGISGHYMGDWRTQIDWDVVTILVMATDSHYGLSAHMPNDSEVFCHAHSKGVRVLPTVDGGGNPANVMNITNPVSRAAWVAKTTATMVALGLDGVICVLPALLFIVKRLRQDT
jgi:hypothetical protein